MNNKFKLAMLTSLACWIGVANANPPSESGVVTREDRQFAVFDVDANAGISSVLGADPVAFCSGTPEFDFLSYADKAVQNDLRSVRVGRGEVYASVWPFTSFDCGLFLTEMPLATGMARVVDRDNDFFGVEQCDEKQNRNSFGYQAHGALESPYGERKQFSMYFHALIDCEDDGSFTFIARTKINLQD
jgi:hypothetical protein